MKNRSIENTGMAFVEGANERNDSFEKSKQTVIHKEHSKGPTFSGTN